MPFTPPENPGPVRAKFYVSAVEIVQGGVRLRFAAVTRGDENKQWAQYTPSGSIEMFVKNELASDNFAPGQEWFVDFTPAPVDSAAVDGG